ICFGILFEIGRKLLSDQLEEDCLNYVLSILVRTQYAIRCAVHELGVWPERFSRIAVFAASRQQSTSWSSPDNTPISAGCYDPASCRTNLFKKVSAALLNTAL